MNKITISLLWHSFFSHHVVTIFFNHIQLFLPPCLQLTVMPLVKMNKANKTDDKRTFRQKSKMILEKCVLQKLKSPICHWILNISDDKNIYINKNKPCGPGESCETRDPNNRLNWQCSPPWRCFHGNVHCQTR